MNVVSGNTYVEHETFTPSSVSSTTWILGWYFLFGLRWSCNILLKTCSSEKRKNAKRIILTYTNFSLIDGRGMIVLWNKISVKNYRPKFNSRILKTAICRGYDSRSKPQTLLSWRIFSVQSSNPQLLSFENEAVPLKIITKISISELTRGVRILTS